MPRCPLCGALALGEPDSPRTMRLACLTGHWDQYVWTDSMQPVRPLPRLSQSLDRRRDADAAERERARELHRQGYSERQIAARLQRATGTISHWVSGKR